MGGGTKWWTWDIPFFTKIHVRHDVEWEEKERFKPFTQYYRDTDEAKNE